MKRLVIGMFIGTGMMELGMWLMIINFAPVFGIPIIGMVLLCAGAATIITATAR